jgi:hypothetical protein
VSNAEGCAPSGALAACGSGGANVCAPSATGSFSLCIYQSGDVACPAGAYTKQTTVSTVTADTRSCTDCTCDTPAGVGCTGGVVSISDDPSCVVSATDSNSSTHAVPSSCELAQTTFNPLFLQLSTLPLPSGGSCNVSGGGQPMGAVTTSDITVCCM